MTYTLGNTPLIDRIDRYMTCLADSMRCPLHPDDYQLVRRDASLRAKIEREFPGIRMVPIGQSRDMEAAA
jgi:hypothetical protein